MTDYRLTTRDVAARIDLGTKATRRKAKALGLGIDLEGRAGFRYCEADVQKLIDSMRPIVTPAPRKKKRAA